MAAAVNKPVLRTDPANVNVLEILTRMYYKQQQQQQQLPPPPPPPPTAREDVQPRRKRARVNSDPPDSATVVLPVSTPPPVVAVLNSYAPRSESVEQVVDPRWPLPTPGSLLDPNDDAMDVDPPSPAAPAAPAAPHSSEQERATRYIEELLTLQPSVSAQTTPDEAGVHLDSPLALDAKQRYMAEALSKNINDFAMDKIVGLERSTLESNADAQGTIRHLTKNFYALTQDKIQKVLGPGYVPTMTAAGFTLPTPPEISRVHIVRYLRAPVPARHERPCRRGESCEGHEVFRQYVRLTADKETAGPQFPPRTQSFALVEFLLPDEEASIAQQQRAGRPLADIYNDLARRECFFCACCMTTELAITRAQGDEFALEPGVAQPFAVIVGRPGEYQMSAMLLTGSHFNGIIAPFPAYRRTQYVPYMHHVTDPRSAAHAVPGWAEHSAIIVGPDDATLPRGEYHLSMPNVASSSSSRGHQPLFPPVTPQPRHAWRSRHFHHELHANLVHGIQVHRMTGDTVKTGLANGKTPPTPAPSATANERTGPAPRESRPLYETEPWLRGAGAYVHGDTPPEFSASQPLTGTGTCTLPTTVQVLQRYFAGDGVSPSVFTEQLVLESERAKVDALCALCPAVLRDAPLWQLAPDRVHATWRGSALLQWVTARMNWALHKKEFVRTQYVAQMKTVSTVAYNNNMAYMPDSVPAHQLPQQPHSATDNTAFFHRLRDEVLKTGGTVVDASVPNQPNRSSHAAVTSDAYQSALPTSLVLTHHRYWAVYYMGLLDRFIDAHMPVLRDVLMAGANLAPTPVPAAMAVPTVYQPFDVVHAQWHWTPMKGHQGSHAVLHECYQDEWIFDVGLYELYELMRTHVARRHQTGYVPNHVAITSALGAAERIDAQWESKPLLPLDLLGKNWRPPRPFAEAGDTFLWCFLVVTGELERLKEETRVAPKFFARDAERRTIEQHFRLHQLQVRQTGYLPAARWLLGQWLLYGKTRVTDASVPMAVLHFPYEQVDFDAELDAPDLSRVLHRLNFWRRRSTEAHDNPLLAAYQKGIPFHSHGRVLSDLFVKTMQDTNKHFLSLAFVLTASSALGVYRQLPGEEETFRPSFAALAKIDFALLQTPRQLFAFTHVTKSKLLIYMSREALVHAMTRVHLLRKHQLLDWAQLEHNTCEVQNLVRQHLQHAEFWRLAPHNADRRKLEDTINGVYEKRFDILLYQLQNFPHKLLTFFNHAHVDHLDQIIGLVVRLTRDPRFQQPENLEALRTQLALVKYDLPEAVRTVIWETLLGMRSDVDLWPVIRQWLTEADLVLLHRLYMEYEHFASKSRFESAIKQFTVPAFTMIYFLLQVQTTLRRVTLVPLPQRTAAAIHAAMRTTKHRLLPSQPLLSSAYHVHVTLCCERVASTTEARGYGVSHVTYMRTPRILACSMKRAKKPRTDAHEGTASDMDARRRRDEVGGAGNDGGDSDGDDDHDPDHHDHVRPAHRSEPLSVSAIVNRVQMGRAGALEDYPELVAKVRRKIVRRLDSDLAPLTCQQRPPLLTLNLHGFRMYLGSEEMNRTAYQHCPRCGDLHEYQERHYAAGRGYMCGACIAETWQPSPRLQRHLFCAYCGRQHFRSVDNGMAPALVADVFDVAEPLKVLHFCSNDYPSHSADHVHYRGGAKSVAAGITRSARVVCLDTFLKRHASFMRPGSVAYFPFQNTVDQDASVDKQSNGFSWVRFGTRVHRIPQAIDVWWSLPKSD